MPIGFEWRKIINVLRKILAAIVVFIAVVYLVQLFMNLGDELPVNSTDTNTDRHKTIAIFGATGTAGDGLLKAALADPDVQRIHVITRRPSARIDAGVATGRVKMTLHMDYLDYSAISDELVEVDAVYWAIGLSSLGLDEETYRRIHVEFPMRFVSEWRSVAPDRDISFHYISGNGANADSRTMWAREKARAEAELSGFAESSNLRVISYRPDYIGATKEEASLGQKLLYRFLAPVNSSVRATAIGQAMLEVSARGAQLGNGTVLNNKSIIGYSKAYEQRRNKTLASDVT